MKSNQLAKLATDERAQLNISGRAFAIISVILGAVVALLLLGALSGTFFSAVSGLNANLSNASTGSSEADAIAAIFPLIVGIVAVLALVGLAFAALRFGRS